MEPEEYEIWAESQADGYEHEESSEIYNALLIHGDLARFLELLPQTSEKDRLDLFSQLILYSRSEKLSSREVLLASILLLEGITEPSPYLDVIIDAVEDGPPEDYLLPVVKYAKRLILPGFKLVSLRYVTVPIVRELLSHVDIEPDTIDRFRANSEALTYLYDMGKIPEEMWQLYYDPPSRLPGQEKTLSLVERYL